MLCSTSGGSRDVLTDLLAHDCNTELGFGPDKYLNSQAAEEPIIKCSECAMGEELLHGQMLQHHSTATLLSAGTPNAMRCFLFFYCLGFVLQSFILNESKIRIIPGSVDSRRQTEFADSLPKNVA